MPLRMSCRVTMPTTLPLSSTTGNKFTWGTHTTAAGTLQQARQSTQSNTHTLEIKGRPGIANLSQ